MTALDQFNQTIDCWINYLDDYSFETLVAKPIPGSWSLGQVYVHILADTPYHVEQMKAALETNNNSDEQMHANAKWMFDNNGFPEIQIDGPGTDDNTPQPLSKEMLLQQLIAIRGDVNVLYRSNDFSKSKGKTRHPGLLFFSAMEWLRFTEMHMRHHFLQKLRIDKALKRPLV
jgi:hypothetical protein